MNKNAVFAAWLLVIIAAAILKKGGPSINRATVIRKLIST